MFKIFKKSKDTNSILDKISNVVVDPKEVIKKIHEEFDTAEDRILQEAKNLLEIKDLTSLEEDASLLRKLGFDSNKKVQVLEEEFRRKRLNEQANEIKLDIQRNILHMKGKYPSLKFLTMVELDRICERYGLIYTSVKYYKGDVPMKNLLEISNAPKLDYHDDGSNTCVMSIKYFYSDVPKEIRSQIEDRRFYFERDEMKDYHGSTIRSFADFRDRHARYILIKNGVNLDAYDGIIISHYDNSVEYANLDNSGLFIAAPRNEFDEEKIPSYNRGHYGYFDVTEKYTNLNDPIVFRFCKGGIQVITKWGLEGDDPTLINDSVN